MDSNAFFEYLAKQFDNQLPFIAYRKPDNNFLTAFLQADNKVYKIKDFTESGFVMSPFDDKQPAILFPLAECHQLQADVDNLSEFKASDFNQEDNQSKEEHIKLVDKGIQAIKEGQFDKVVLSRKEAISLTDDNPINLLIKLLKQYPTAFVYCWYHPKIGLWLGATPETLLKIKDNKFKTMALAGTQVYNGTLNVVWEQKELDEQQFVTDFIIDNLQSKQSRRHIQVSELQTIRAGNLLHLKTDITININPLTFNFKNVLKALHPTPAVCGLPKETAKEFILKNEGYNRQFYSGFLGELNVENQSNLFVNLRCVQLQNSKAYIFVGGGVTKDSNAEKEWQETVNKSKVIKSILL